MAEHAAALLLQTMESQIKAHWHLVSHAGNELKNLQSDVKFMADYLGELTSQPRSERSRAREKEIRDVLYQAEDLFDESLTRAALAKFMSSFRIFRFFDTNHVSMASQVKFFRKNTISPLFETYGIKSNIDNHSPSPQPSLPITPQLNSEIIAYTPSIEGDQASTSQSHINDNSINQETPMRRGSVVGFEQKAHDIINSLTEEHEESYVLCITGMPGLGKSTLARKVYDSGEIREHFPIVVWVEFSTNFEKRKVLLSIWKCLGKANINTMTDNDLAKAIELCLKYKSFLLIFDDVWNMMNWMDIETALPRDNRKGRVLITSRRESVATTANWRRDSYRLDLLGENRSWDLLQLQVFDNLNVCPPELKNLGRKIASQCGGSPLAIKVIAGVLLKIYSASKNQSNDTRDQWEQVSNSVTKFINEDKRTEKLIGLSYNELKPSLKYCFLYLGVFPQESRIPIRKLIGLWIAEGFICRDENRRMSLEDVAKENLNELIDRNLVMVDYTPDGEMKTCRVHCVIRDFCKREASYDNCNLFQEMEMLTQESVFNPPVADIEDRRRICIHSHIENFLGQNPRGPRVHSLLCSAKEAITLHKAETSPIPQQFERLRVVDVTPIKLTKFPSKLTELIHLRYIVLCAHTNGKDLWALPKEVSRLWNLQSITIDTNSRILEIKANLWKMVHLRHLKTKAAIIIRKKLKGPAGKQLQSFSRLSTQCCTEGVFSKARNIQNLGICGDLNTILELRCLSEMESLLKLKLVHDVHPAVASEKPLSGLPDHLFPSNLRILQLSGTFLTWNQIRTLQKLLHLKMLKLKINAFMGKYWKDDVGCFRSLETLVIADTNLEIWEVKDDYFPSLECLELKDCKKLKEIPFEHVKSLQILRVKNVSDSAIDSAKNIAEKRPTTPGFKLIIN